MMRGQKFTDQKQGIGWNMLKSFVEKLKEKAKKDNKPVLLVGEHGTEKELIANLIHQKSSRAKTKLQSLNLSPALSTQQLKSLFYGRTSGSSTVDLRAKNSLFDETKGGTLFINNLESLPEEIAKVIAAKEFSRLGSNRQAATPVKVNITTRFIGGATQSLAEKNQAIFNFFSTVLIQIPPLRERTSDIPLWINHCLEKYNQLYAKKIKLAPAALQVLSDYDWPGNVDELEGLIERLVLTCSGFLIEVNDLPFELVLKTGSEAGKDYLSLFEAAYVQKVFNINKQDKQKTASDLGINHLVLETKL